MKKILLFILFIALSNWTFADSRNFSFKLEDTTINVRAPNGFYESSYIDQEISQIVDMIFPPYLFNVHATLVPKNFMDELSRYIILVSLPEFNKINITRKDFADLRVQMRQEQYTLMNEISDDSKFFIDNAVSNINSAYDADMDFSYNETTPLGVFLDSEKAISFNTIMAGNYSDAYSEETTLQIGSTSFIYINKRVLIAYIYTDFNSQKDIIWIEGKTKELIELLLKNNK